jgi:hypothetical protein
MEEAISGAAVSSDDLRPRLAGAPFFSLFLPFLFLIVEPYLQLSEASH